MMHYTDCIELMVIQDKDLYSNSELDGQRCKLQWVLVELVIFEVKLLIIHMININQTDKLHSYKLHVQLEN